MIDREKFELWLKNIGFRENGIKEIIQRIEEDRADLDDISLLQRFRDEAH